MKNWEEKLDIFLSDFEHIDDAIGVLVCGSYVTGNPTLHSDLDVHIILNDNVNYREQGNKVIDGLLIEYFANPPKQIFRYFEDDFNEGKLMAQTQFATGKIIQDKTGNVAILKEKALMMIDAFYENGTKTPSMSDLTKYFLWDMLDDLLNAYEIGKLDFDFLYFNSLSRMMSFYMQCINRPYNIKTILGNVSDDMVRGKYLLRELPDATIRGLIAKSITTADKRERLDIYERLTKTILDSFGGFSIGDFKFKSKVEA